jgi:hypothetical protein
MEAKELKKKAGSIVEAFAAGRTCEQILEADSSLTYHDIFHAVAEMPTSHWKRYGGSNWFKKRLSETRMFRRAILHRTD